MSKSRHFDRICVFITILALIFTVLFMNGQALGISLMTDADSEAHSDSEYFTENDQLSDWDTSTATTISLNGDSVSINGGNAYVYDGNVVISNSGRYVISGTLDDGYITVDANDNSKVWIMFRDVDITCSDNACLRVDQADKVFLTLADGSENTLTGGEELSDEALEDGTYGVIFSHDDLTINGSGSLQITAGYKHGIKANDDLVITGGDISIDAPADGIHVNDSFRIKDASISITAGDDGILTENTESFFYMESGSVSISSKGDGIHSSKDLTVAGGSITIDAGDDALHADDSVMVSDGEILANTCYEGIEALTIEVTGGDITLYPTDDGFNANGGSDSLGVQGAAPMQGMMTEHNMAATLPEAGFAETESPGTESAEAGSTEKESSGTESAGAESAETESPGTESVEAEPAETESTETEETWIRISGGSITIINKNGNDADGLDSNGDLYITGGEIRISLTDNGMNCAIDVATENGGKAVISGGTIIACGSGSMAESFDNSSEQCSVMYNVSESIDAGDAISVTDTDGNELISWDVPCSFSSALISCPAMELDETITIAAGEMEEQVILSTISTTCGDAQANTQGMMPGANMGAGGMQPFAAGQGGADSDQTWLAPGEQGSEQSSEQASEQSSKQDSEQRSEQGSEQDAEQDASENSVVEEQSEADAGTEGEQNMGAGFAPPAGRGDENGPGGGNGHGFMSEAAMQQENSEETVEAAVESTILSYDREVYILLGLSVISLVIGLAVAVLYRK